MIRITLLSLLLIVVSISFVDSKTEPRLDTTFVAVNTGTAFHKIARLTRDNFEDSVRSLYRAIDLENTGLSFEVFRYGMIGFQSLKHQGKLNDSNLLSLIDFTKPSTEKRFYTIDLTNRKLVFHSLVSHGRNTGENIASKFSDVPHSNQSSLGFYITGETYVGSKGYSLRLDGVDPGYNASMRSRAVVMHEANYVSDSWIKKYGRLGRSQGCPALPAEISKKVIDTIKDRSLIFAYFNDATYLNTSAHLDLEQLFLRMEQMAHL